MVRQEQPPEQHYPFPFPMCSDSGMLGILNVRTDVDASCSCTQGLYKNLSALQVCTESGLWDKLLLYWRIKPVSVLCLVCWPNAMLTELHPASKLATATVFVGLGSQPLLQLSRAVTSCPSLYLFGCGLHHLGIDFLGTICLVFLTHLFIWLIDHFYIEWSFLYFLYIEWSIFI